MPFSLQQKPEIWPENEEYLRAFFELNECRQSGLSGALRIYTSELLAYCQMHDIDQAERPLFFRMITRADSALMDWLRKQKKSGS